MLVSQFKLCSISEHSERSSISEKIEYHIRVTNLESKAYSFNILFKYATLTEEDYRINPITSLDNIQLYRIGKQSIISSESFQLHAGETREFGFALNEGSRFDVLMGHVGLIAPAVPIEINTDLIAAYMHLPGMHKQADHPIKVLVHPFLKRIIPNETLRRIFYEEFGALEALIKICIPQERLRNFRFSEYPHFPKYGTPFLEEQIISIPVSSGASLNEIIPEDPREFEIPVI